MAEEEPQMELSVLKFDFFKIITDHEYFVPINLPLPYNIEPCPNLSQQLCRKHPQAAALVKVK